MNNNIRLNRVVINYCRIMLLACTCIYNCGLLLCKQTYICTIIYTCFDKNFAKGCFCDLAIYWGPIIMTFF